MKTKNIKPWIRFMYRDYLESERVMDISCAAEGIYIRCLALQAIHGTIPADLKKLAKLMRRDLDEIEPYWPEVAQFFEPDPDDNTRLFNETQRNLMIQDGNYSEGSKKGHETRKKSQENPKLGFSGKENNSKMGFSDTHTKTHPSRAGARTHASASVSVCASDSASASQDEEESAGADDQADAPPPAEVPGLPPPAAARGAGKTNQALGKLLDKAQAAKLFEEQFWPRWPTPRKNKHEALKAWLKLCPSLELTERMIASLEKDKLTDQWSRRKVVPHASTWINQERWTDEHDDTPEEPPRETSPGDGRPPDDLPEFDPLQPELWTNALYQLHIDDPDGTDTWIKPLSPLGRAGDEIWIAAQSQFQRDMVARNYRERITHLLQSEVRLIVMPEGRSA